MMELVMGKASTAMNAWLAGHHGVITVQAADQLGVSYRKLKYLVDRGT